MNKAIKDLNLHLAHFGINCRDQKEAHSVSSELGSLLNLENRVGNSSIFVGDIIEVMKYPFFGKNGHIALKTDDLDIAIKVLQFYGYGFDMSTLKVDTDGSKKAIYLEKEIGGFAVHLLKV